MPHPVSRHFVPLLALAAAALGGCFPVADPRLPENVASALAEQPMRVMEGSQLRLYFPEARRDEARLFLTDLDRCATHLRWMTHIHNDVSDEKLTVIMPEIAFNNAFVAPRLLGYETEAVVPTLNTMDAFALEMGLPPDPARIGCHEITHAVHMQQLAGFAWFWNLFGAVYTPQIGLDPWFDEGLAVYYETRLHPETGRLVWPLWNGAFAAGVAGHRINGGDLSADNRDFHLGNHYLIGSHFVRFLAQRYGEDKLWRLIEVQGRSIFFPLWVNVRFWQAYDKSLSTLIDEFADANEAPVRPVPAGQRSIRPAGYDTRYVRAADGREALFLEERDRPARVVVYDAAGRRVLERELGEIVPPRHLQSANVAGISGASFTPDGRALLFVSLDAAAVYSVSRLYRLDLMTGDLVVLVPDLGGPGGALSPDGRRYLFARADGDHHDLAELDLATSEVRILNQQAHGAYVVDPRYSPDGTRILCSRFDGRAFRLVLFDAANGRPLQVIPTGDGPVSDASFVDDHRILFLGVDGKTPGFQVFVHELASGRTEQATHVPYLAFQPRAAGGTLRFLNRGGWNWTLDEVELPAGKVLAATTTTTTTTTTATAATAVARATTTATARATTTATLTTTVSEAAAEPTPEPELTGPVSLPGVPLTTTPPVAGPNPAATPPEGQAGAVPSPPAEASPSAPAQAAPPGQGLPPGVPPAPYATAPAAPPPFVAPPFVAPPLPPPTLVDEPYRWYDHLFVPRLYGPTLTLVGRQAVLLGLVLSGHDRLQHHRWTLAGYWQFAGGGSPSVFAGYTNRSFAPWTATVTGYQFEVHDVAAVPAGQTAPANPPFDLYRRDRGVDFDVYRSFFNNPIDVGFSFVEVYRPDDIVELYPRTRIGGPHVSASFTGYTATPYTGAHRLISLDLRAAHYPAALTTLDQGMSDVRGELDLVLPLPLLRRHTLSLALRGRALPGAPADQPFLILGGYSYSPLLRRADTDEQPAYRVAALPVGATLAEPLRGFEDYALYTNRAALGDALYRYPLIIDHGWASTLGLLPSLFIRQLDLDLFAAGAIADEDGTRRHLAAGGALTLRTVFWQLPLFLRYQLARRLTDDDGTVHLLLLGS